MKATPSVHYFTLKISKMNSTILIQVKEVWGNGLVYVVSEQKDAIQNLTGRKTLTPNDLQNLKALGFEVKVKTDQ